MGKPLRAQLNAADHAWLLKFWKIGLPPREALLQFGDPLRVAELKESWKQSTTAEETADYIVHRRLAGDRSFGASPELFELGFRRLKRKQEALAALENDVAARIERGELVAVGFLSPAPNGVATLAYLQIHMVDRRPGWSMSDSVEANGVTLDSIRIARADAVQEVRRKAGRPSREPSILLAWEQMKGGGRIDTNKDLNWHFPDLRERVKALDNNQSDKGLGDKKLSGLLGKTFRELEASRQVP